MAIGRMRVLGVLSWMAAMAVFLQLAACSATPAPSGHRGNAPVGSSCSPENVTQACVCEQNNAPGSQACSGGVWMTCQCAAANTAGTGGSVRTAIPDGGVVDAQNPMGATSEPPGNSSPARFDWHRTTPMGGSCEPGHYVGAFTGKYYSPVALNTATDVASVDTAAVLGGPVLPGLELTLNKSPGSGEIFDTSGGKIRGTANGSFPFEIDLKGKLDCSTGKFTGTMDGWYSVATIKFPFLGTIDADYNKITHQFINGTWTLHEPTVDGGLPPFIPPGGMAPGGSGSWNADWKK